MKTLLGTELPRKARAVLYLCDYNHKEKTIKVNTEIFYSSSYAGLEAYANIPNPASQLASGSTIEKLEEHLEYLHKQMQNPEWVAELSEYL